MFTMGLKGLRVRISYSRSSGPTFSSDSKTRETASFAVPETN